MAVERLQAALLYVKENLNRISWEVIRDSKELQELAIELNQKQLLAGHNSADENFGGYSARHARKRADLGLQTSHIDLRLTGKFYEGFVVEPGKEPNEIFRITSTNDKTSIFVELIKHRPGYGEDIFGLTEENLEIFRNAFQPKLEQRIALFLNA